MLHRLGAYYQGIGLLAMAVVQAAAHDRNATGLIANDESSQPLRCFQVANPVDSPWGPVAGDKILGPADDPGMPYCNMILFEHEFENSYGSPLVGKSLRCGNER